jgi:hypothetical protein
MKGKVKKYHKHSIRKRLYKAVLGYKRLKI